MWSDPNLYHEVVLEPFEIIPTPSTENSIIKRLVEEFNRSNFRVKDHVFIISKSWWDAWTNYVHYDTPTEANASMELEMGSTRKNARR
jgi:hypothetical protein